MHESVKFALLYFFQANGHELTCYVILLLLSFYTVFFTLTTVWRITGKIIITNIMLITYARVYGVLTILG